MVRHAKMMGFNGIALVSQMGTPGLLACERGHRRRCRRPIRDPLPPDETAALDSYRGHQGGRARDFPRLGEYGGTEKIPENERAIGPNGAPARPNRFARWCADLLQPVTFKGILRHPSGNDREFIKDNPQIAGIMFRIRCQRLH